MDFYIGPTNNQSPKEFLEKEAIVAPYSLKLRWESVPEGFLPIVLMQNVISPLVLIAYCEEKLEELASMSDDRYPTRTIYFMKIEKLLPLAGHDFIEYVRVNGLADEETILKAQKEEEENLQKLKNMLFEGRPEPMGGLSNENALVRACPKEFKGHRSNPWSTYASRLFFSGGNISNWEWKSQDEKERNRQFACFNGLLGSFGTSHEDKEAVAGWMLSEMLEEVPQYAPKEA